MIGYYENIARHPANRDNEDYVHEIEEEIVDQVDFLLHAAKDLSKEQFFVVFHQEIQMHIIWLRSADSWTEFRWEWMLFQANMRQ